MAETVDHFLADIVRSIEWRVTVPPEHAAEVEVKEPPTGWYDARTRRRVTRVPGGGGCAINGLRIVMDDRHIPTFMQRNRENIATWMSARQMLSNSSESPVMHNGLPLGVKFVPSEHVPTLCADFVETLRVPPPPPARREDLTEFDFNNIFARATIRRIIDGDTFDAVVDVPSESLRRVVLPSPPPASCLSFLRRWTQPRYISVRLKLRLYGVNAAENSTPEGRQATDIIRRFLSITGDSVDEDGPFRPVWVHLGGRDKYGRILAVVYTDASRLSLVNSYLVDVTPSAGPVYAVPYHV